MTRTDLSLALLALAVYAGFCGIIVFSVRHPALIIVCLIGIAFAGYDIWKQQVNDRKG